MMSQALSRPGLDASAGAVVYAIRAPRMSGRTQTRSPRVRARSTRRAACAEGTGFVVQKRTGPSAEPRAVCLASGNDDRDLTDKEEKRIEVRRDAERYDRGIGDHQPATVCGEESLEEQR